MASVFIFKRDESGILAYIDYSLVDGRIRSFEYEDRILYDEDDKFEAEGWKDKLWQLVLSQGFNIDDGKGLHAFVYPLIDKYDSR